MPYWPIWKQTIAFNPSTVFTYWYWLWQWVHIKLQQWDQSVQFQGTNMQCGKRNQDICTPKYRVCYQFPCLLWCFIFYIDFIYLVIISTSYVVILSFRFHICLRKRWKRRTMCLISVTFGAAMYMFLQWLKCSSISVILASLWKLWTLKVWSEADPQCSKSFRGFSGQLVTFEAAGVMFYTTSGVQLFPLKGVRTKAGGQHCADPLERRVRRKGRDQDVRQSKEERSQEKPEENITRIFTPCLFSFSPALSVAVI